MTYISSGPGWLGDGVNEESGGGSNRWRKHVVVKTRVCCQFAGNVRTKAGCGVWWDE